MKLQQYLLAICFLGVDTSASGPKSGVQEEINLAIEAEYDTPFAFDFKFNTFERILLSAGIQSSKIDGYLSEGIRILSERFGLGLENIDLQKLKSEDTVTVGSIKIGFFNEPGPGNTVKAKYRSRQGKVFCPEVPIVSTFLDISLTEDTTIGSTTFPKGSFLNYGEQVMGFRGNNKVIHVDSRNWVPRISISGTESYATVIFNLQSARYGSGIGTLVSISQTGRQGVYVRGTYSFPNNVDEKIGVTSVTNSSKQIN